MSLIRAPVKDDAKDSKKEPSYPCELCADQIPYYYCNSCKAEHERRQHEEQERERAKHRQWYAQRKLRAQQMQSPSKPAPSLAGKPRNPRQSSVPVSQTAECNLTNHSLSGLQAAILRLAITKRVPGARGCDVSHPELFVEIWGWKTRCKLRWTEEDARRYADPDHIHAGDTVPSISTHGAFNHISRAERRSARASLSRALTRLQKRMLISFVNGTLGTYGGGIVLTPDGEEIARQLVGH